ncbi:MAG: cytochrome c oxidase subunit 3 [Actinomycetota bacterium]
MGYKVGMLAPEAHAVARPTDPSPIRFGAIVFLASELLFFGGLFAAYFTLRAATPVWPPAGVRLDTGLSALATVILVASSFTFIAGLRAATRRDLARFAMWLWVSLLLGVVFLSIQVYDWTHVDFEISSNAYGTMYYALTGFHGLHVVAGIVLMFVLLGRMAQGAYGRGSLDGPEAVGYYWHFVDVVWIGLFATIFLLR